MSFANKILPRLGQSAENQEWYVNAIWKSLNEYMVDIETAMAKPQFTIAGITTVPGAPPIQTPVTCMTGQVSNKHIRLTYPEVKAAMWCGDGNMTFPNLFKLFASKLMKNFTNAYSTSIVTGITGFVFDATSVYSSMANTFMAEIKSLAASGSMNAQTFHNTFSRYLDLAFKSLPPVVMTFNGMGQIPTGPFVGTITIAFQQVIL